MKKYNIFICYFISLLFMEVLFKLFIFDNIFSISVVNLIIYNLFISCIFSIVTKLFNMKFNKILSIIIICFCSLWFSAQYVCKDYFE